METRCPERQVLTDRVVAALQALYRARDTRGDNGLLLRDAREARRLAERALNARAQEHGCED
jgi:hypothetical protein